MMGRSLVHLQNYDCRSFGAFDYLPGRNGCERGSCKTKFICRRSWLWVCVLAIRQQTHTLRGSWKNGRYNFISGIALLAQCSQQSTEKRSTKRFCFGGCSTSRRIAFAYSWWSAQFFGRRCVTVLVRRIAMLSWARLIVAHQIDSILEINSMFSCLLTPFRWGWPIQNSTRCQCDTVLVRLCCWILPVICK